jgi:hypothetical protein
MLSGGATQNAPFFPVYIIVNASEDGDNPMPFISLCEGVLISRPTTSSAAQQVQYCGNELYSTERVVHHLGIQYTVVLCTRFYSAHYVKYS